MRLVVTRTSSPVSVVSNTRSMVSLAVVWLTYCFFFAPLPCSLRVLATVYCRLAGLKCTGTAKRSPVSVSKRAASLMGSVGCCDMAGSSAHQHQALVGQMQFLDADLGASGVEVGGLELDR